MEKLHCDKSIGTIIRKIRMDQNLQQVEVITFMQLEGIPMTKSSYSKIEAGRQHIKISELIALKKCFGVRYDDFFEALE